MAGLIPAAFIAAIAPPAVPSLAAYKDERLVDFRDLVSSAVASLEDQRELVDWFDFCTRLSEAQRSWA